MTTELKPFIVIAITYFVMIVSLHDFSILLGCQIRNDRRFDNMGEIVDVLNKYKHVMDYTIADVGFGMPLSEQVSAILFPLEFVFHSHLPCSRVIAKSLFS